MDRFVFLPQELQEHIADYLVGRVAAQWINTQPLSVYDKILWLQIVNDSSLALHYQQYKHHRIVGLAICKAIYQEEMKRLLFSKEMYLERAYAVRNYMEMWNTPPRFWNQDTNKIDGWYLGRRIAKTRSDPV